MSQAIYLETDIEKPYSMFFYENDGFYFTMYIDSEFPFEAQGKRMYNAIHSTSANRSLEDYVYFRVFQIKPKPTLFRSPNKPGHYYPRMWRGTMKFLDATILAGSRSILSRSVIACDLIAKRLFDVFTYIEPIPSNFNVFGHKTREVLLLSCMEVESSWASVLTSNNYKAGKRLTTKDYVKLLNPMLLDRYEVEFPMYPEIGTLKPFHNWDSNNSTISIPWYDAYNKTKHNIEDNFDCASLHNAILSVSAIAVMLCAQFGPEAVPEGLKVSINSVDKNWHYIPLATGTHEILSDGAGSRSLWDLSPDWTKDCFTF